MEISTRWEAVDDAYNYAYLVQPYAMVNALTDYVKPLSHG